MSNPHPAPVCEFQLVQVAASDYSARAEYRCQKHGTSGFNPSSTITEFGAYTLCPMGQVEFAVERALERLEDRAAEIMKRMGKASP